MSKSTSSGEIAIFKKKLLKIKSKIRFVGYNKKKIMKFSSNCCWFEYIKKTVFPVKTNTCKTLQQVKSVNSKMPACLHKSMTNDYLSPRRELLG